MFVIPQDRELLAVLTESKNLGFLGPGPVADHLDNAAVFVDAIGSDRSVLDLGSGGGLPGLALARWIPDLQISLVDASTKRTAFLQAAVERLELSDRVDVVTGRAEELARGDMLRHAFNVVVARSFGPPAVVAECAVGFLEGPGARIIVSEPPAPAPHQRTDGLLTLPTDPDRWPAAVAELGLQPRQRLSTGRATVQELELTELPSDRFPRRNGIPAKRPLFV